MRSDERLPQTSRVATSRRAMLHGAILCASPLAPLLAACEGGDQSSPQKNASDRSMAPGSVAKADVPVGGGVILTAKKAVVTQPVTGTFKAFSAICTHQGCTVGRVTGGEIVCPCHGSHYSITDGSPVAGPAASPLAVRKMVIEGSTITVT